MIQLLAKPVVEKLQHDSLTRVEKFRKAHGRAPKLAVVLVGENPASVIYVRNKGEAAHKAGMEHETVNLPATTPAAETRAVIEELNRNAAVDGILIQRPLPAHYQEEEVIYWVAPEKDVDAFHPTNTGLLALGMPRFAPCTPAGVMVMLKHYGIDPSGKVACVIGRSSIVGKPMAALLLQANATVLHCHSKTPDLKAIARQADIVVAAIGKPNVIDGSYLKEGAVVIDVGINRIAEKKITGDVDYESASKKASAITPVPGGVGPMTIALLLQNTIKAAELREK